MARYLQIASGIFGLIAAVLWFCATRGSLHLVTIGVGGGCGRRRIARSSEDGMASGFYAQRVGGWGDWAVGIAECPWGLAIRKIRWAFCPVA